MYGTLSGTLIGTVALFLVGGISEAVFSSSSLAFLFDSVAVDLLGFFYFFFDVKDNVYVDIKDAKLVVRLGKLSRKGVNYSSIVICDKHSWVVGFVLCEK